MGKQMTRHFTSLDDPELVAMINTGAIGVIPTDTVYGLVAKAGSQPAVERLYATKPRELAPGTMIGAGVEDFVTLGFDSRQLGTVAHYWPAALSVVLDGAGIAHYLKQRREAIPVRIPDHPALQKLLTVTGPLMTTSANAPGEPTSTTVQMAIDYFGKQVDFYVDGGDLSGRPPSTIVGINPDRSIIIYRQGAVQL